MRPFGYLAAVTALIGTIACSVGPRVSGPEGRTSIPRNVRVQTKENGLAVIRMVDVEEYVRATVLGEFAPSSGDPATVERMLEVQAIVGRTFAVTNHGRHGADGFDLCSSTHCQIYEPARIKTSRWKSAAETALSHTNGIIVWYDSRPAEAVFHADCGGYTAAAEDVWGGTGRRYLLARPDEGVVHANWEYSMSVEQARAALNKDSHTSVGQRLNAIDVAERDRSGRAIKITIRGAREIPVTGEELRRVLTGTFGARSIRSTKFDVRRAGDKIVFNGRGFGHGVGLCQAGALARLRKGATPEAVLEHYFPGTRMGRI
jgi:stage II sporulation protein D (peptidoglycan lytic transglycosylase)